MAGFLLILAVGVVNVLIAALLLPQQLSALEWTGWIAWCLLCGGAAGYRGVVVEDR